MSQIFEYYRKFLLCGVLLHSVGGLALSTSGRVQTHYGESVVEGSAGFEDGSSLQGVPNGQKYASGLLETHTKIKKDSVRTNFRYLYDAYGDIGAGPALKPSSALQVRHLAWHRTLKSSKLGASVGRFPISDIGILGHDGVLAGTRMGSLVRLYAFIGLVPDFNNHRSQILRQSRQDPQGGGYAVYEKKSPSGYYAHVTGGLFGTAHPDTVETQPQILGVHSGILSPWSGHRFTSYLKLEVSPAVRLRQIRLGYSRAFSDWSHFLVWSYSNTTSYQLLKDVEDSILNRDDTYGANVGARTTAYLDTQYRFSTMLTVQFSFEQTTPSEGGAVQREVSVGPWVRNFPINNLSLRVAVGQRIDVESTSLLYRGSLRYYSPWVSFYSDYRLYPGASITSSPRRETRIGLESTLSTDYLVRFDHMRSQTPSRHRSGFLLTMSHIFGRVRVAPPRKNPPFIEGGV